MINLSQKSCETSARVLDTLKLFINKNLSIQDIISFFETSEHHCKSYTPEAIFKYLNTIKIFGLNFAKVKDKYHLLDAPIKIDFNEKDIKALKIFEEYSSTLPEKNVHKNISEFLQNLEKFFSCNSRKIATDLNFIPHGFEKQYKRYESEIQQFEQYCVDKLKVKVEYSDKKGTILSIIAEPKCVSYRDEKVYISLYNPISAKIQEIDLDTLISISQLPLKSSSTNILMSVTYNLYGRLAKGYKLHYGERIS